MTNLIFIILLSYFAGIVSIYALSVTVHYFLRRYNDLTDVRDEILKSIRDNNIDQAYLLVIRNADYRSICWARENRESWDRIRAFEQSIFDGMAKGTITNPFSDDTKAKTIKIEER